MSKNEVKLENFLIPSTSIVEKEGKIFPTVLSMDIALSGGIPEGVSVLMSGKPKVGKTTLALHYVQQCHRISPEKKVFFFTILVLMKFLGLYLILLLLMKNLLTLLIVHTALQRQAQIIS